MDVFPAPVIFSYVLVFTIFCSGRSLLTVNLSQFKSLMSRLKLLSYDFTLFKKFRKVFKFLPVFKLFNTLNTMILYFSLHFNNLMTVYKWRFNILTIKINHSPFKMDLRDETFSILWFTWQIWSNTLSLLWKLTLWKV